MTAASLRAILAQEFAAVGVVDPGELARLGRQRFTRWSTKQPGFGTRHYRSGERVYVVQTRINGVVHTVTICNAAFVSEPVALDVARRVLLRAQVGENPVAERARIRSLPPFDRFLAAYWKRAAPSWKPSTQRSQGIYRRQHLDGAFADKSIEATDGADVAAWYVGVADRAGPGAVNRTLDILRAVMNAAEEWGKQLPGSNPCLSVRRYRGRKLERHLSKEEMERVGRVIEGRKASSRIHAAALTMLLLTGCRCSEIIGLTWREASGWRLKLADRRLARERSGWVRARGR